MALPVWPERALDMVQIRWVAMLMERYSHVTTAYLEANVPVLTVDEAVAHRDVRILNALTQIARNQRSRQTGDREGVGRDAERFGETLWE